MSNKEITSFHLKASHLKLWETPCHWQPLQQEQAEVGRVCCLVKDRFAAWNLFVIVEVLPEFDTNENQVFFSACQNKLRVIYPRLPLENNELILGQDKSSEEDLFKDNEHERTCQLNNIRQGCCFDCTCKVGEQIKSKYPLTFQDPVNNEGDYKIHTIDGKILHQSNNSVECVKYNAEYINFLDQPVEEIKPIEEKKTNPPKYVYVIISQCYSCIHSSTTVDTAYNTMEEAMINLPETYRSGNHTVNFSIVKVQVGNKTKKDILSAYHSD